MSSSVLTTRIDYFNTKKPSNGVVCNTNTVGATINAHTLSVHPIRFVYHCTCAVYCAEGVRSRRPQTKQLVSTTRITRIMHKKKGGLLGWLAAVPLHI